MTVVDDPRIALVQPTADEKASIIAQNASSWAGPLSREAYFEREKHLHSQDLTKEGGITHWALVSDPTGHDREVFASCETIRKNALVTLPNGRVEEVVTHGIGSVFCDPTHRGNGYAGRMMRELGKKLETWQTGDKKCLFTMLYSDIGQRFYAAHGWFPFPSSHVALPPIASGASMNGLPEVRHLVAADLPELCDVDERILRRSMHQAGKQVKVAVIPDVDTMRWHHAREEFVGKQILDRTPAIKGAIIGDKPGHRAWCIWVHVWTDKLEKPDADNVLYILRLVVESEGLETVDGVNGYSSKSLRGETDNVAALLRAAQNEAAQWHLKAAHVWNPSPLVLEAAQQAHNLCAEKPDRIEVMDRDSESIASLMWHGDAVPELSHFTHNDVEWIANEKYAWC